MARENIYRLLDQVLETGQPLEIERKGRLLRVVPGGKPSKIARLVKHDCLRGDPEEIVHIATGAGSGGMFYLDPMWWSGPMSVKSNVSLQRSVA